MGWFENQIQDRRDADQQLLEESFLRIAGVVMGEKDAQRIGDARIITKSAIDEILKYYHYKPSELPESITDPDEQLDYCLRPHGMMRRSVELKKGWYKDAYGPILAFHKEDGSPVALLPGTIHGYYYKDAATGKTVRLNAETERLFDADAVELRTLHFGVYEEPLGILAEKKNRRIGNPAVLSNEGEVL